MTNTDRSYDDQLGLNRIMSLSDGLFSVVIAILIFDIKFTPNIQMQQIGNLLHLLAPKFLSYSITFFLIGVFWVGHHSIFRHVKRYDRTMIWINILFLMCVAFLPFPAQLVGGAGNQISALIIYGSSLIAAGLSLSLLWHYVTKDLRLVEQHFNNDVIRLGHQRILMVPAVALLSIISSFISPGFSLLLYLLVALVYLVPSKIERKENA